MPAKIWARRFGRLGVALSYHRSRDGQWTRNGKPCGKVGVFGHVARGSCIGALVGVHVGAHAVWLCGLWLEQ